MMFIADTCVAIRRGSTCAIGFTIGCCGIDVVSVTSDGRFIYNMVLGIGAL